ADERSVFDHGLVFALSVVVAGNGTGSDVHGLADFSVSEIGQVIGFGAFAQTGLLGLNKISYMRALADLAPWAEIGVWPKQCALHHLRLVEHAARADQHTVSDHGIINDGVGA